jgi:hypothetical protein
MSEPVPPTRGDRAPVPCSAPSAASAELATALEFATQLGPRAQALVQREPCRAAVASALAAGFGAEDAVL